VTAPAPGRPPERQARIGRVEVTTASATGAAHVRRGVGSDDAVSWTGADGDSVLATVAIADGHSDRRCVRSRTGAAIAVAAATALPSRVVGSEAIAATLIAEWRHRVDLDLVDHPMSAADLDGRDPVDAATTTAAWTANARLPYGTTAALCRITGDAVAIVQVGDGDVVAVAPDGQARRIASAPHRRGDVTDSLSGPDAQAVARCADIPAAAAPVLLILATDGFDNAYPSDGSLLRAATELAALRQQTGRPIGPDVLTRWARDAAGVSGDDATVAAIWVETTVARPAAHETLTR
jgi:serine/threonine protein phosphatase PrpC